MAKSELKTKETGASVDEFLKNLSDSQQAKDSREIINMMERLSGEKAKMWGTAIIGFGQTVLKYDSGRELDWMKVGFSPRKGSLTLYGLLGGNESHLENLGTYKTGKGCLYIKRLTDIDTKVLEKMIRSTLKKKG